MNIINQTGFYGVYKKNAGMANTSKAKSPEKAGEKTDVVSISQEAVKQRDVSKITGEIAQSVAGESASPERIQSLKEAVSNGTYNVSSDDLADAILGRAFGGYNV